MSDSQLQLKSANTCFIIM